MENVIEIQEIETQEITIEKIEIQEIAVEVVETDEITIEEIEIQGIAIENVETQEIAMGEEVETKEHEGGSNNDESSNEPLQIGGIPVEHFISGRSFLQLWTADPSTAPDEGILENYGIIKELCGGGFAKVFLAERVTDGLKVAMKISRKRNPFNEPPCSIIAARHPGLRKITSEINALIDLHGVEGVTQLLDVYTSPDGIDVLILETFEDAVDLFELISEKKRMIESEAQYYFKKIMDILIRVYERGYYHLDVKDENILVRRSTKMVILLDFGGARRVTEAKFRNFPGTNCYCPPEYVALGWYFGMPLMSWTIGWMLVNMCTGNNPASEKQEENLYRAYVLPQVLSPELKSLIASCLDRSMQRRPTLTEIINSPWATKIINPEVINDYNQRNVLEVGVIEIDRENDVLCQIFAERQANYVQR